MLSHDAGTDHHSARVEHGEVARWLWGKTIAGPNRCEPNISQAHGHVLPSCSTFLVRG